uniref:Uncharacterized protein n=2 Tax=Noccaea caerulescens TaxID=107243 RepID=A0A1J3CB21_NOCCA
MVSEANFFTNKISSKFLPRKMLTQYKNTITCRKLFYYPNNNILHSKQTTIKRKERWQADQSSKNPTARSTWNLVFFSDSHSALDWPARDDKMMPTMRP